MDRAMELVNATVNATLKWNVSQSDTPSINGSDPDLANADGGFDHSYLPLIFIGAIIALVACLHCILKRDDDDIFPMEALA